MTPQAAAVPSVNSTTPEKWLNAMPAIVTLAGVSKLALSGLLLGMLAFQRVIFGAVKQVKSLVPASDAAQFDQVSDAIGAMALLSAAPLVSVGVALIVSRKWFSGRTNFRRCVAISVLLAVPVSTDISLFGVLMMGLGCYTLYALFQPSVRSQFTS